MPIVLVEMVEMPKMKAAENSNVPQLSEKSRDHLKTGPVLNTQSFLQQHRLFVHIFYVQCRYNVVNIEKVVLSKILVVLLPIIIKSLLNIKGLTRYF